MTTPADLTDLISHRDAWRRGLERARDTVAPAGVDHNDYAYWQHEIDVFDRTFDLLELRATAAATTRRATVDDESRQRP